MAEAERPLTEKDRRQIRRARELLKPFLAHRGPTPIEDVYLFLEDQGVGRQNAATAILVMKINHDIDRIDDPDRGELYALHVVAE